MGQGVVWRVRPRGTFALGSGRRDFLSTVELRGDGGVEVAGGEGTEEEGAGGLEVVRRRSRSWRTLAGRSRTIFSKPCHVLLS